MKRLLSLVLTVGMVTLGLVGCGSEQSGGPVTIHVMISGTHIAVDPDQTRIHASVNQPITLAVHADAPGEIHVHSSPEQEFTYAAGETDLTLTIDKPGVVDVESHTLDTLLFQLEVS